MNTIVILGTGLAGYTVAREFRKLDKETPLLLISADDGCFYSKPMLSNALSSGKSAASLAMQSAAQMATQLNADVRAHTRVTAINPVAKTLTLNDEMIAYGKLVLAVGADPIKSALTGDAAQQVFTVNDLSDYARFRAAIEGKRRVAVIGGGLIGCEFANDLSNAGYAVEVIHPGAYPLTQLLPHEAGHALSQALAGLGVRWHFGKKALGVDYAEAGYRLSLSDGTTLEADAVLSAIGLKPRTALAEQAGLAVKRGIVVNKWLATSAADVYALGDCAEVEGLVLPFVMPIMQAARALAQTLAGTPTAVSYPAMPVAIKTPACPVVVSAPPAHPSPLWQTNVGEHGVRALCYGAENTLHGFVLTGKAVEEKAGLIKTLPPWL